MTDLPKSTTLALDDLVPYARNARTHSPEQINQIARSIQEFGFLNPIIVDGDNGIVAGHGRVLAARQVGMTAVPAIDAGHLTPEQVAAYVIADNQLALNAGWDDAILSQELNALRNEDFDLSLIGFSDEELDKLLAYDPNNEGGDIERVPDPLEVPVTESGDMWILGDHRLICGDSTDAACVERLLNGARPHLMVTDPPYGVNYDPEWRHRVGVNKSNRLGKVENDDNANWSAAWSHFPGDIAYVWHGALHTAEVIKSLADVDLNIRAQIIWAKERLVIGRGDYHWQHEPCIYAVRKGKKGRWASDRKQTTLWQIASRDADAETTHGTQKPVECMRRPMVNNSVGGDAIYEPFMGSGTTIIAGESCNRLVYGIEIDPAYVDVAVMRWQNYTGRAAVLDGDGRTFSEIRGGDDLATT